MDVSIWKLWIKKRGISKTARDMEVTRQTVHAWLRGEGVSKPNIGKLIRLSGYAFTMADFADQFDDPESRAK